MPTLQIVSTLKDDRSRRRFAKKAVIELGRLGVNINHILIIWQSIEAQDVFLGTADISQALDDPLSQDFALLTLDFDNARPSSWISDAQQALRKAAAGILDEDLLFIRLSPVSPANYWNQALAQTAKNIPVRGVTNDP